jgi:hypothetical protein
MTVIELVDKELHMKPKELLNESLKSYLIQRLSKVETELFVIAKKYGVKSIFELDSKIQGGVVSEKDSFEDYFAFDNLEAEREKIKQFIEKL